MSYPFIQAKNYGRGRARAIRQITLHYMVVPETNGRARWCANYFAGTTRKVSCTYYVDNREIIQGLKESDTPWTDGKSFSNSQSITIECAGSTQTRAQWMDAYSTAMRKKLVKLCADICRRYNIPVRHLTDAQIRAGEKGFKGHGDVTRAFGVYGGHTDMGVSEGFPWDIFLKEVAAELGAPTPTPVKPPTSTPGGYLVTITASELNVRSGPGTNYKVTTSVSKGQVYTIVETKGDWGKLKSGAGWIHLGYTSKGKVTTPVSKKSNEAVAREVIEGKWGNGDTRKARLRAAGYDYEAVRKVVNRMLK